MTNFPNKYKRPAVRERQLNLVAVEEILAGALRSKKIDKQVSRYKFVLHWDQIVGEELAKICKPDSIVNKQLIVKVKSSVWAQQLSFYSETITKRVQKYLEPDEVVEGLRFRMDG